MTEESNLKQVELKQVFNTSNDMLTTLKTLNSENLNADEKFHDLNQIICFMEKFYKDVLAQQKASCKTFQLKDRSIYSGQTVNNLPHGLGRCIMLNKGTLVSEYIGFWTNGIKGNMGIYKTTDITSFGEFIDNEKNGYNYTFYQRDNKDNFSFVCGNFKNDKLNGSVYVKYMNNVVYSGYMKNSKKNGKGCIFFNSPNCPYIKICCTWNNNNIDGFATFYRSDGYEMTSFLLPPCSPDYKPHPNTVNGEVFCYANPYTIVLPNKARYNGECRQYYDKITYIHNAYYENLLQPNRFNIIFAECKKKNNKVKKINDSSFMKPGNKDFCPHGLGFYSDSEHCYRGYFEKGNYTNFGFMSYKKGSIKYYHGEFKNNKPHGKGIVKFAMDIPVSIRYGLNDDTAILETKSYKAVMTKNKYFFKTKKNCDSVLPCKYKYAYVEFYEGYIVKIYNNIDVDNFVSDKSFTINDINPSLLSF